MGTDPNLTVTHDFEERHLYEKLLLPRGSSLLSLQIGIVENFLLFFPNRPELNTVLIIQTGIFSLYKGMPVKLTQKQASLLCCQNEQLPPSLLTQNTHTHRKI